MSGRAIIFVVTGVIIISSIILTNIEASSNRITANFSSYCYRQSAQNIAQSGVLMGLRQLTYDYTWRTGLPSRDLFGGKVQVRAFDTTFAGMNVIAVRASARGSANLSAIRDADMIAYGSARETTATSTAYVPKHLVPPPLKGVLTTNGPTASGGGLVIDGRDHTLTGALIPNQGVYGVWSSSTFSQGGGSSVGGTVNGVDFAPSTKGKSKSVQQNYPTMGPTTPDSVFGGAAYGYPEGTLKSIAQSGAGGSQYATDPSKITFPISGVTYVELPSGGIWNPPPFSGSGILVVHNSSRNAVLSNVAGTTFRGIIIGDDILHIQNIIIGAVVGLTSSPSAGNLIGNGNGQILYSSAAIKAAVNFIMMPNGVGSVVAWYE